MCFTQEVSIYLLLSSYCIKRNTTNKMSLFIELSKLITTDKVPVWNIQTEIQHILSKKAPDIFYLLQHIILTFI